MGTKIGIFDPDPLPDHQIGVLRRHLEKFPPAAPRAAPAGQGRCLPAPTPAAGERANPSTVHAPPRPLALGLGNLKPAAPCQPKKKQTKTKSKLRRVSQGRLSCCRCAELLNSLGASDVGSKCEMTSCGVSPAANRTRTCRVESVCCSHGVRLSAARMRAYASARVRFLLCSRSHCSSIPKFSGLRRCGFAPEARNFLGTRHAEKMVASMTFMTSKSSRIVVSKVYGVNTDVKCAILVTIMQS